MKDNANKKLEIWLSWKQERTCFNCKFYDGSCCMYDCACRCILHEGETAEKCEHFTLGEYDQDALEESNYK